MTKPKILIWDIETTPNEGYVWGKYDQNVIAFKKEWELWSVSWRYLGEREIHVMSQKTMSEAQLVAELWGLIDDADFTIAHNGDDFDIKKARTKFIQFGHKPFEPGQTIDTLKLVRKYFAFTSNKLDDVCAFLGLGRKIQTGGFQLWLDCMDRKQKAMERMERYNKHDVRLLTRLYLKVRPWIYKQPAIALTPKNDPRCPTCMSSNTTSQGSKKRANGERKAQRRCNDCGGWYTVTLARGKK